MKNLLKSREAGILIIFIVLSIVIAINSEVFLRPDNIIDMLKSNSALGIMALGMLLVIITGGIDVSVSAVVAAITVIIGKYMVAYGGNLFLVILLGCLSGIALGALNGLIISRLEIPPIVTTLGMMSIINGVMLYYTNGAWINDLPQWFLDFGKITIFSIPDGSGGHIGAPIQIFFLIGAGLLTWFVLKYTLIGRGVYAFGGNPISAQRVGYNIRNIQLFTYTYMGFLTGIAAVVHTSIMKQVDPNAFLGFELQVIAAVVLGGANILGGSGTVFGTVIGVLLLAIINNGLILMRIPTFWQDIVVGAIIVIAVSIDVIQHNREEKRIARVDVE